MKTPQKEKGVVMGTLISMLGKDIVIERIDAN